MSDRRASLPTASGSLAVRLRSEEHTSELQSLTNLVCRLLLEKKKQNIGKKNRVPHPSAFSAEGGDFDVANDQRPRTNDGFPIHALTDITGFGLIGHLREMLLASENVSAQLYASKVPLLKGAIECVRAGHIPGGLKANREFAECVVQYKDGIADDLKTLLFD